MATGNLISTILLGKYENKKQAQMETMLILEAMSLPKLKKQAKLLEIEIPSKVTKMELVHSLRSV
jgi:predicted transposase YdaD